ncbi:teichoic acid ABC transporter ATP-binding protein [Vandammella animalimorsus]|uniref:Teichoic acid ABC transporter ATP-binding protein n=1 Tax=Vandammella animalimorsus TaxID=2029117 RepID=A0A2A2T8K7_9BURK|nr:ABC transporter ATP-binding protein [Vandammella animalimorsus]PAT33388.1 teichoic acid ABC transporter ATP-binding protein [Vandammella animalimorsus]PAX18370.1 teichoic acid ABC transporter ATP-binding protein [Vandammella animalimorsus]PAX20534.1 teichoic acid ABC transporter ATP-binding protein [Vandammella animalimorsus]
MSYETAIKVENLKKCYQIYEQPRDRLKQFILPRLQRLLWQQPQQYYREFWALKGVTLDVRKGETVGILGRNGSGKSTLLQIITGTLAPTSGWVETHGRIAALLELGSGFNPDFTGRENVYLNGSILGFSKQEMDERFDEIAAFADIGEHLDRPIKTYSSGMVVRLAFAVQACVSPQVLIVDEALSVGDEKFQRKCFDYIERLREEGCSILLVTHSTATVEKFCQRGVLLHKGNVHGIGPAKEIVDQYHALLYSDEKTYIRYLQQSQATDTPLASADQTTTHQQAESLISDEGETNTTGMRAVIAHWQILDASGNPCDQFMTGETMTLRFCADVLRPIDEIQAGLLIRTVEGVSAFGTSTLYHQKNFTNAQPGTRLVFDFELRADLCAGTYFATLAIAEAISHGDMTYLDRKTDVIVFTVHQPRILASGIAMLDTKVMVTELGTKA